MTRNPNRMQEAVTTLMNRFQTSASVLVTYTQGATVLSGIAATESRWLYETIEGGVVVGKWLHVAIQQ